MDNAHLIVVRRGRGSVYKRLRHHVRSIAWVRPPCTICPSSPRFISPAPLNTNTGTGCVIRRRISISLTDPGGSLET